MVWNQTQLTNSKQIFIKFSTEQKFLCRAEFLWIKNINIGNNSAWLEIPQDSLINISGEIFKGLLLKDIKTISNGGKGSYWKGSANTLKRIYSKVNGGNMINEDVIEEEINQRIKTRIENETGYKVYLIRDNQGIEVYLKSKYCPKGQRYDIVWFQSTENVEKQYNLRDKTIDSAKIKQVCKNEFGIYKEDVNYFDY